jgi:hypothetical protein
MRNLLPIFGVLGAVLLCVLSSSVWGQRSPNPQSGIVWQASIGGTGDDAVHAARPTADNGWITVGYTRSRDGDITESYGRKDVLAVKLDSAGKVIWKKAFGGREDDLAYAVDLTADGGYVVAGSTESHDWGEEQYQGGKDFWIIKLSSAGDLLWRRWYGGSGDDIAMSIRTLSDGSFIVAGFSDSRNGNVTGNNGESDAWVLKLDSEGRLQWQNSLGGEGIDGAFCVTPHSAGGYMIAGQRSDPEAYSGGFGLSNHFFARVSDVGKHQWTGAYGDLGEEITTHIEPTTDGGYLAIGSTNTMGGSTHASLGARDVHLLKLNAEGQLMWEKFYGGTGDDAAFKIRATTDGGFIFIGETNSFNHDVLGNHGQSDVWLVKLNSAAEIEWQKCFGGTLPDKGCDVWETSDGAYLVAGLGSFFGENDVQSGHPGADAWVFKYRP